MGGFTGRSSLIGGMMGKGFMFFHFSKVLQVQWTFSKRPELAFACIRTEFEIPELELARVSNKKAPVIVEPGFLTFDPG